MPPKQPILKEREVFSQLKESLLDYDPTTFVKKNLSMDGEEFSITGNGWDFMADIYRYIVFEATQSNGKPVVIKKGRQVGATMMAGALDLFFTNSGMFGSRAPRVMHVFPDLIKAKRFSQDKLENLIRTSRNDFINKNKLRADSRTATDNQTMKQFKGGTLWVDALSNDGDRIRGMTVDIMFIDEVQDAFASSIRVALRTLTASRYGPPLKGVQVFFGTPKERGSHFHTMWEQSDQRYYHLGCINCNQTYPFYLPNDNRWMDIWLHGYIIKCPLCGHEQHKIDAVKRGKWVPTRDPDECKYIGFHPNQLYIPYATKEAILSEMPDNNPDQSERGFLNEILGEFYASTGDEIPDREEVRLKCADYTRGFASKIDGRQKKVYAGLDWGQKTDLEEGGKSYSTAVVLSEGLGGVLHVEHAHKLKFKNFTYKKQTVNELYRRFGVSRAVADVYWGQDVVTDLQEVYRDRFLGAQGSGNLGTSARFREEDLVISYNKDLMIEEVYNAIRKGKIRIPWKDYDMISWFIDHIVSMEVKLRRTNGQMIKTYVKGGAPNDGFMALIYAYMAYKFDKTKGYSIKPGSSRPGQYPMPQIAHLPRLK